MGSGPWGGCGRGNFGGGQNQEFMDLLYSEEAIPVSSPPLGFPDFFPVLSNLEAKRNPVARHFRPNHLLSVLCNLSGQLKT